MACLEEEFGVSVEPAFQLGDGDELAAASADDATSGAMCSCQKSHDTPRAAHASATLRARRGAASGFMVVKPGTARFAQATSMAGPFGPAGATDCATDGRP
jgi:hypothetical protein